MIETGDPEVLRREIAAMLETLTDHGSLLFARWLLRRVLNDAAIPPDAELRKLRGALVRIASALRDGRKESTSRIGHCSKSTSAPARPKSGGRSE